MGYRNKTYVCFDADNDIHYYRLMQAWAANGHTNFDFFDAHDVNTLRAGSSEATVKAKLRQRFSNAKVLVVLIGDSTRYLYKFVRWEIEIALNMGIPIIAVNLNKKRSIDNSLCPPILRDETVMHISFNAAILQHALDDWPMQHQGANGSYYYVKSTYQSLGL